MRRTIAAAVAALLPLAGATAAQAAPGTGGDRLRVWSARVTAAQVGDLARAGADTTELDLPVENLLTPDHVRRLAWNPPAEVTHASLEAALVASGARPWQREQTVDLLLAALADA